MISAVGIRNLTENHVDSTHSRNVLIAALIIVLSIGISYSAAGAIVIPAGSTAISLSGLAIGSLVGIVLNIALPGKKDMYAADGSSFKGDERSLRRSRRARSHSKARSIRRPRCRPRRRARRKARALSASRT